MKNGAKDALLIDKDTQTSKSCVITLFFFLFTTVSSLNCIDMFRVNSYGESKIICYNNHFNAIQLP